MIIIFSLVIRYIGHDNNSCHDKKFTIQSYVTGLNSGIKTNPYAIQNFSNGYYRIEMLVTVTIITHQNS